MKREIRDLFYSAFPKDNYLQYGEGDTNLIITAPHGGGMRPFSIPRRKYGKRLMDTYTRRLSHKLLDFFAYRPYYIIADIHRSRVDLNRDLEESAQGNLRAELIWRNWNFILSGYKYELLANYDKGLYIDIHSQGKTGSFQLGYDISALNYRRIYNKSYYKDKSTLDCLNQNMYEMLFGESSIKSSLESFGYDVMFPKGDELYFNGGRNIEEFSCNGLGAVQIECPTSALKKDLNGVATALYYAIETFREEFVA